MEYQRILEAPIVIVGRFPRCNFWAKCSSLASPPISRIRKSPQPEIQFPQCGEISLHHSSRRILVPVWQGFSRTGAGWKLSCVLTTSGTAISHRFIPITMLGLIVENRRHKGNLLSWTPPSRSLHSCPFDLSTLSCLPWTRYWDKVWVLSSSEFSALQYSTVLCSCRCIITTSWDSRTVCS